MTDEERLLLVSLMSTKRSRAHQQALMKLRDRRIAVWSRMPTFPALIRVVRLELEALAAGTDLVNAMSRFADNHSRKIAYDLIVATESAIENALPRNREWVAEDAMVRAGGEVLRLVARETRAALEWVTERDARVCEICDARDGVVYASDEAPALPAHPRCRCAYALAVLSKAA